MQKCLNDEYEQDIKSLSNPVCWLLLIIILIVACIFPVVGINCYTSWKCPPYMDLIFLELGLVMDVFIVILMIPCFARVILNCCYDTDQTPKVPPPPKTNPPKWAFKSFSESATGRSKSLTHTENPLTTKGKVNRTKSDSEV